MTAARNARGRALRAAGMLAAFATAGAAADSVPAGAWQVKSTIVDLDVPGLPGFLQRMAKGHTTVERKCVHADQTVAALLAPDPKARCHVDRSTIGGGRYAQDLTCPQKRGGPMTVTRTGTYDANGFSGRAMVNGAVAKGALRITMDQRAVRTGGPCPG